MYTKTLSQNILINIFLNHLLQINKIFNTLKTLQKFYYHKQKTYIHQQSFLIPQTLQL